MTSNHLLLYRIAELMLEKQQHLLPVDDLFDDEQIGDFVKSIQIDSPYQQMLLEGVLTESVKDEKLFVSFTVEGYFHYVLGEVMYLNNYERSGRYLEDTLQENQLIGIEEGIEQCLILEVMNNNLSIIVELIDIYGISFNICQIPLAYAFLQFKGIPKSANEIQKAYKLNTTEVIRVLFRDISDNKIEILNKTIDYLKANQKNDIVKLIHQKINDFIVPDTLSKASLYVNTIEYLPENKRLQKLNSLISLQFNEQNEKVSLFYNSLAGQFGFISEYGNAKLYYEKSLEIYKSLYGVKHEYIATLYNNLGSIVRSSGNYEQAIQYYKQALDIRLNNYDKLTIPVAIYYNNIGVAHDDIGNYDEALLNYEKSLQIFLRLCGGFHPITGFIFNNIGLIYLMKDLFDIAIKYFENALAIRLKIYGESHSDTATTLNCIGGFFYKKLEYNKAIEYFERALNIRKNIFGIHHTDVALSYNNIASVLSDIDKYEKAIIFHNNALEILEKVYDDSHPNLLDTKYNLGRIHSKIGNYNKAIELISIVYKYEKKGGYPFQIALAYEGLNKMEKALTFHIQAAELRKDRLGIKDENTIVSINKCIKIAKAINQVTTLPTWIKKHFNDI
jgi:tetratricopeptide (TPR) repeat protein